MSSHISARLRFGVVDGMQQLVALLLVFGVGNPRRADALKAMRRGDRVEVAEALGVELIRGVSSIGLQVLAGYFVSRPRLRYPLPSIFPRRVLLSEAAELRTWITLIPLDDPVWGELLPTLRCEPSSIPLEVILTRYFGLDVCFEVAAGAAWYLEPDKLLAEHRGHWDELLVFGRVPEQFQRRAESVRNDDELKHRKESVPEISRFEVWIRHFGAVLIFVLFVIALVPSSSAVQNTWPIVESPQLYFSHTIDCVLTHPMKTVCMLTGLLFVALIVPLQWVPMLFGLLSAFLRGVVKDSMSRSLLFPVMLGMLARCCYRG